MAEGGGFYQPQPLLVCPRNVLFLTHPDVPVFQLILPKIKDFVATIRPFLLVKPRDANRVTSGILLIAVGLDLHFVKFTP